ncbi:MAG: TerB family tellurite resistance protein [Bacteroidota bacterium]
MTSLTDDERDAIATLCLMAALADGWKDDRERDRLRSIYSSLDAGFEPERYERVLLGEIDVEREAARLRPGGVRTLTYEMAVAVCDADGRADDAETAFLQSLRAALGLDASAAEPLTTAADALADDSPEAEPPAGLVPLAQNAIPDTTEPPALPTLDADAALDPMILRYAIGNAALELLPQKAATLAVVPMQTKMVYRIGQHFAHELNATKAKELLGAVGLGLTSQVIETYARGLLGGLAGNALRPVLGKKKSKKAKKVARTAAGSAFQFAATYALGHAAKAYYAGGRTLATTDLRSLFDRHLARGQELYAEHRPAIEQRAKTTDVSSLLGQLRQGTALPV